jgi:rRNA maturation protein Nop10
VLSAVTKKYKSGVVCVVDGSDLQPPLVPPFSKGDRYGGYFLYGTENVLFWIGSPQ